MTSHKLQPFSHSARKELAAVQQGSTARGVDGGVTATGVLSRERGNLITIFSTR